VNKETHAASLGFGTPAKIFPQVAERRGQDIMDRIATPPMNEPRTLMPRPRRLTDRPLPPYRHIPGRTPHPTRDPDGHSYGHPAPTPPSLDDVPWRHCPDYLCGVDLFNERYWWECHEVFEGLWHAAGHRSPAGECLQALIQCAVAHLKTDVGNTAGARQLLSNAARHAEAAGTTTLGVDLVAVLEHTRAYARGTVAAPAVLEPYDPPSA